MTVNPMNRLTKGWRRTKQEYYDLLVSNARNGNFPCVNEYGQCAYRLPDGRGCGAGILLHPDDHVVECVIVTGRDNLTVFLDRTPKGMTIQDVQSVQSAHDWFASAGWDSEEFIKRINKLECFAVVKQEVTKGG